MEKPSSSSTEPSHSVDSGSFANVMLNEDTLVKEQASAETDLDLVMHNSKLTEQLSIMEENLQNALEENAQLKVKQEEHEKLWREIESKFSSTKALCDTLNETLQQINVQVQKGEKEYLKLGHAKNVMETSLKYELNRAANLLEEKDGTIKQLKKDVATDKMALDRLTSMIEKLQLEIRVKANVVLDLSISKERQEGENQNLFSSKNDYADRSEMPLTVTEVENLDNFVNMHVKEDDMLVNFRESKDQRLTYSEKVDELNSSLETYLKLARQEKDLISKCASVISEKNALQLANQELNNTVLELQKEQEFAMVQLANECELAKQKTRKLESEAETLVSKQTEMQSLIGKLETSLSISSEKSRISDKIMQDLSLKYTELQNSSKGQMDGLKKNILKKQDEVDLLQKKVEKCEQKIASLEERVNELELSLEEKDQFVAELKTKEKQLDDQKTKITVSLADTESKLEEATMKYDQMLENKDLQLLEQLTEISQRNDQAIDDIRRKYELKKQEIIRNLKDEHAKKETSLISKHKEKLQHTKLQAENELREKIEELRSEYQDVCKRFEEEKQMALWQLQRKVMSDNPQKVTSKKRLPLTLDDRERSDKVLGPDRHDWILKPILLLVTVLLLGGVVSCLIRGDNDCIMCSATKKHIDKFSHTEIMILPYIVAVSLLILAFLQHTLRRRNLHKYIEWSTQFLFGLLAFYISTACPTCRNISVCSGCSDVLSLFIATTLSLIIILFLKLFFIVENIGVLDALFAIGVPLVYKYEEKDVAKAWSYVFLYTAIILGLKIGVEAIEKAYISGDRVEHEE